VHDVLALGQVLQAHATGIQPFLPRLQGGEVALDLVVLDDATLGGVDDEHASGAQAPAALDALRGEVEHAGLEPMTTSRRSSRSSGPGAGRCGRASRRRACRR
jgi:hypothetical protein